MNSLVKVFLEELERTYRESGSPSVSGGAVPYLVASRLTSSRNGHVVVLPSEEEARKVHGFLQNIMGAELSPDLLSVPDHDPYEGLPTHPAIQLRRAATLTRAVVVPGASFVVSPEALLYKAPRPGWWKTLARTIESGDELDRKELRLHLWRCGYRDTDIVGEVGEVSFRGGIMDVFPPGETLPVRIEFFGDEVETVRYFDPATQGSLREVTHQILCHPLSEAVMEDELLERLKDKLSSSGEFGVLRLEAMEDNGIYPSFDNEIRFDDSFFGPVFDIAGDREYLATDSKGTLKRAESVFESWRESFKRHRRPPFLAPERLFVSPESIGEFCAGAFAELTGEGDGGSEWARFPVHPGEPFKSIHELRKRIDEGYRCLALMHGRGALRRLQEQALEEGLQLMEDLPIDGGFQPGLYAAIAPVEEGIVYKSGYLLAITEKELFHGVQYGRRAASVRREAFSSGLRDLKPGDYLVHVEHGIGMFEGLKTIARDGTREDYLSIAYSGADRLLLPVARMDLIQKYVGPEGATPQVDKLGTAAWQKKKAKVRRAVKKIAIDLLRLYASRRRVKSRPFPPDSPWQADFESEFPYALTPDQERAVIEIKKDLESDQPMDRLVCGDVGFGKTEVAMRSAFKVIQAGRQVAILCPTTVLAMQHTERFRERFEQFSVRVEMLSRFLSQAQQRQIVKETSSGDVQILIGTHRMLSKDVNFSNLGLLVVDEEQRFGVGHKEKIKTLKSGVDVLTLTATPIPRTLQMGLSGILSMSLIQTPPKDRLSIQTVVTPYDEELVVAAVERELARDGQLFYVHNQVESIDSVAKRISELVPDAKVGIAHGQMDENNLEDVITKFFRGDLNTLVTTTIIENGVDLSRVNTLLVENAQNFGLTQLYQLRGRIGRSDVPAYAYLMIPGGGVLKGDAEKRLATLREFSELGAGFRVAAADLELRGAGNFLGAEQSGHMASVGFDLYLRMLEEAVAEEKGEPVLEHTRCELNLGIDLSVPAEYMSETSQRLSFYRELALAMSEEEIDKIKEKTEDRFGRMDTHLSAVFEAVKLRLKSERNFVKAISRRDGHLSFVFEKEAPINVSGLVSFLATRKGSTLDPGGSLSVALKKEEDIFTLANSIIDASFTN